ncbi:MAG: hypothetical protein U1E45_06705 [Geminicoccaceae bacterium]
MRLAIVLGLLALLVPFGPARAIDEDPCKDIEDTIPSLKACIEDLTKRIVELESEGDEAEAPEEEEKKKPEDDLADRVKKIEDAFASTLEVNDLKIKGALQVLDGEEVVFVVQPEDGGLRVEGKSSGGTGRFLLTATSDLTGLRAYSGDDKVAGLLTRQEDSSVFAGAGGVESNMVTGSDFNGWQLKSGDKEFANIGRPAGRAVAVRVMDDQGHAVVSAGSNPALGGAGQIAVTAAGQERASAFMAASSGGTGSVYVTDGKVPIAGIDAAERYVALFTPGGQVAAALRKSKSTEGGNVSTYGPGGEQVFSAGSVGGGGGDACVWRKSELKLTCLGIGLPLGGGG